MRSLTFALATTLSALCLTASYAADEKRQLDAHEHGHGTLNIAIEGNAVAMELEAPGADIAGFEHDAKSDADKAAVTAAKAKLAEPLKLFVINPEAGCKLAKQSVELHAHKSEEGHSEHKDGHHDHHDKHKKHDHAHEAEGASHNEYHAEYKLTCAATKKLTTINFAYFDSFAGAKELSVKVITEKKQSAFEVTRAKPTLNLQGTM